MPRRVATSVYSRAVRKAAELVGGREELARTLKMPRAAIEDWIAGKGKPPREIFLRVVDLIIADSAAADGAGPDETPPSRDATPASSNQRTDLR